MPAGATFFAIEVEEAAEGRTFVIDARPGGVRHGERTTGRTQHDYLDLFARLAPLLGTRVPRNRLPAERAPVQACHRPLLTRNIAAGILYGYGDPCVLRVGKGGPWHAVVTSNDAPDAFPILRTADLERWQPAGFVFPQGRHPAWAMTGPGSDFWAPELHTVGDGYLLCFSARAHDGTMALGIARAKSPQGPFEAADQPLLRGNVIDAHLFATPFDEPLLLWKEDTNALWPERLVGLIERDAALGESLFDSDQDRRTAALAAALWRTARHWPPMERFFVLQPLIEAVVDSFAEVRRRLVRLAPRDADALLEAMRTQIFAQRLAADGSRLLGEPARILENDLAWEAHLIEGPWLTREEGRYYLFYAGNDFSTHAYGIGVAVGPTPLGPFRKMEAPLLRSDERWIGPGHPSVAPGPTGDPQLFYHAFAPGRVGYNEFRALLTCGLRFRADGVETCALF